MPRQTQRAKWNLLIYLNKKYVTKKQWIIGVKWIQTGVVCLMSPECLREER